MKIKKYILMAAAAVFSFAACQKEMEEVRILDPSEVVPPVLHSTLPSEIIITSDNTGESLTFTWDKAYFGQNTQVDYSVFATANGKNVEIANKIVGKTADVISYSMKYSTVNQALVKAVEAGGLGLEPDVAANVVFSVAATIGTNYQYFYSDGISVSITPFAVKGNPWADFTEESTWSLIGAIESVGMNWDGDIVAMTNGSQHVVTKVKLATGDQFKFRKDKAWGTNRGAAGDTEPYVMAKGESVEAAANGKNLAVSADGIYDVLYDEDTETITITEAWFAYPGFDEQSAWSVIGAIASVEMNWDKDISMTTDGTWHVAEGVTLTTSDQFKFRKDQAWGTNIGATGDDEPFVVTIGEELSGVANGKNLAVPADGVYDLLVNPDENLYKVVESLGGHSPLVGEGGDDGGDDNDDETYKGWGIIGAFNDWAADAPMTQDGDVWTGYFTNVEDGEFKLRKDADWEENYGGTIVTLGEPFEAVSGGDNLKTAAGFFKVVLDLGGATPTITVSDGNVWSLIGEFNEWGGDLDMNLVDGKWVSPAVKLSGEFKIRHNHDWEENLGGEMEAIGKPFAAVSGGSNIKIEEEGNYIVTYDPEAATITVDELGWGLVGTINGWGETPDIILKEDGLFMVAKNVTLTDSDEIKLRYNQDWEVNRGGRSSVGYPVKAVAGGDNIKPGAGTYDIYYRPDCEVIMVVTAGTTPEYWGVVGTINSWSAPDHILYQTAEGLLESDEIELVATDEIKIRMNEEWKVDRGGAFSAFGEAFEAVAGGANIALGRDATIQVIYDATAETITIKGKYNGDAPAFAEYIYLRGADTSWGDGEAYALHSGKAGDAFNGKYKGFGYLSGEFKFMPSNTSWDGDWEYVGEGKIGQGTDNCPAPATAGYYMIDVDLNEMTYGLTAITSISIIGTVKGNWDTDVDLTYNTTNRTWEVKDVALDAGVMKFRANHDWAVNWGGAVDALVQGGDNLNLAETGTYDIVLYALCDGKAKVTITKK